MPETIGPNEPGLDESAIASRFPGEVVTRALVRDVELPYAAGLAHPERVVGFRFFNPVAMMPLVAVVRAAQTDDAALATALAVGKALKKNCVLVKDAPAFVVNRLLTRFLGEILACVDESTSFEVAEHAPDPLGLSMSPFRLAVPPRWDHALPGPLRDLRESDGHPVPAVSRLRTRAAAS